MCVYTHISFNWRTEGSKVFKIFWKSSTYFTKIWHFYLFQNVLNLQAVVCPSHQNNNIVSILIFSCIWRKIMLKIIDSLNLKFVNKLSNLLWLFVLNQCLIASYILDYHVSLKPWEWTEMLEIYFALSPLRLELKPQIFHVVLTVPGPGHNLCSCK